MIPNPLMPLPHVAGASLLLRLALAAMWLSHAIVLKLMTFGMDGLAQWMAGEGFAPLLAYPLVIAEVLGGLAIGLGVHGRWASLLLLPVLAGATAVHAGNGWVFTAAGGGWEYPVFLGAASLVHALLGDGPWALRPAARLPRAPQGALRRPRYFFRRGPWALAPRGPGPRRRLAVAIRRLAVGELCPHPHRALPPRTSDPPRGFQHRRRHWCGLRRDWGNGCR